MAQGLFQPLGYAAASVVIWVAVIAGLVGRALPAAPIARPAGAAGLCLAATAVLATASVAWADDQGRAFAEAVRVSFYLGLFALAACTASGAGRRQWRDGLAAGLAVVTVIALLAYLQPGLLGGAQNEVSNAAGRLSYPLGYWNGMAALLAVASVLFAYVGAAAPDRVARSVATALMPLALLGIWLADSRGGAAAAVIGVAILLAASPARPRQLIVLAVGIAGAAILIGAGDQMDALRNGLADSAMRADGDRMSALAAAVSVLTGAAAWLLDGRRPGVTLDRSIRIGAAAATGLVIIAGIVAAHPAQRFRDFKAPPSPTATATASDASSNGRWQFWSAAVDAFESDPAAGIGAGGYEDYWARHASVPLFVRNAHSLPLQQGAELGLLGVFLFIGFLAAVVVAAWKRLAAGRQGGGGVLIAVLVAAGVGAAIDWTWELPAAFGPAVICAALLTASAPALPLKRDGYWLGVATVAAAWVAMIAAALVVLAEIELRQSRSAAADDNISEGIHRANQARTVEPWSAEPYTQLALLEEERGNIPQALADLRKAESRDSGDWRLPLIEARLQQRRGDGPAARIALERAHTLSPLFGGPGQDQG
jgi:hypothetical protein